MSAEQVVLLIAEIGHVEIDGLCARDELSWPCSAEMFRRKMLANLASFDEQWELFEELVDKALLIEAEFDLLEG